MNIRHFVFAATAATLSFAAAAAPSVQPTNVARIDAPLHEHGTSRLSADDARHMRGTYQLSDGRALVVTSERSRLFAQLDGKTEELVPADGHTFVARDSRTRVAFNAVPFADEVVVTPAQ
jgi:hypothetical protein